MTCIAGIEHAGKVYIAGDSAASNDSYSCVRSDPKVWVAGGFAFGFTTSFRMGQLLRYSLVIPDRPSTEVGDDAEFAFMAGPFVEAVRETLTDGGWVKTHEGRDEGGCFLVGWRGKLYVVGEDFGVGRYAQGFYAIGDGGAAAEGALWAISGDESMLPQDRLVTALSAAEQFVSSVSGPFEVVVV